MKNNQLFQQSKNLNLKNPTQIGLNISDRQSFNRACQYANGGIIGSAFIKKLGEEGNLKTKIKEFIKGII
jgi:tryptophan synthase alpha chain